MAHCETEGLCAWNIILGHQVYCQDHTIGFPIHSSQLVLLLFGLN